MSREPAMDSLSSPRHPAASATTAVQRRRFTSHLKASLGLHRLWLTWVGAFVATQLGAWLAGIQPQPVAAAVVTAIAALAISMTWLQALRARPALALDSRGLELRGLGQIGWSDIAAARWREELNPKSRMDWFPRWIELKLAAPLARPSGIAGKLSSLFGATVWVADTPDTLRIQVNSLDDDEADLRSAFDCFLNSPIRGA
jgi:hypothetical protein